MTAEQLPFMGAGGHAAVLDVRQDSEFLAGHVPGARHVELGVLADRAAQLPARPTVVSAATGSER